MHSNMDRRGMDHNTGHMSKGVRSPAPSTRYFSLRPGNRLSLAGAGKGRDHGLGTDALVAACFLRTWAQKMVTMDPKHTATPPPLFARAKCPLIGMCCV